MKTQVREVDDRGVVYKALVFVCPGCKAGGPEGYDGLHILPINCTLHHKPSWTFNGDLEKPTLTPSILTNSSSTKDSPYPRCHSYLTNGMFKFLDDSTHPLKGCEVPIPDLPDWAADLSN